MACAKFRQLRNTPLKKHMLLRHRLLGLQATHKSVVHTNIKILELFLDIFRKKYLRQPSIDFDLCNLSPSGDVVYKGRW